MTSHQSAEARRTAKGKSALAVPCLDAIASLPADNRQVDDDPTRARFPRIGTGKWQHLLVGIGSVFAVVTAAWLASGTTGAASDRQVRFPEPKQAELAQEENGHPATAGDLPFTERARATEDGFKAAFPLRR